MWKREEYFNFFHFGFALVRYAIKYLGEWLFMRNHNKEILYQSEWITSCWSSDTFSILFSICGNFMKVMESADRGGNTFYNKVTRFMKKNKVWFLIHMLICIIKIKPLNGGKEGKVLAGEE